MKIECSPEEFLKLIGADKVSTVKKPKEPIAGLSAPPSKEMDDYLASVGGFVFEHTKPNAG